MQFTVKYKLPNGWFWRKIKNVEGDSVVPENGNRVLFLADKTRIELPQEAALSFSPARFEMIKEKMAQETGKL